MKKLTPPLLMMLTILLSGCANDVKLGHHMVQVRTLQVYNPNASQDNLGVVPDGSGERMEKAYQSYTGKSDGNLGGNDSQFLDGFAN